MKAKKNFKTLDNMKSKQLSKEQIKTAHKQAQKSKTKQRVR